MKKLILMVLITFVLGGCAKISDGGKMTELMNMEYDMVNQPSVYGASITSVALLNSKSDVTIFVKTGVNRTGFFVETKGNYVVKDGIAVPGEDERKFVTASQLNNRADFNHYVNPTGSFTSKVYKNKKGLIKVIILDQKPVS